MAAEPLISRIKIMAKLDIAERRRPQDGRIKVMLEDRDVTCAFRSSTQFGKKLYCASLAPDKGCVNTSLGFKPEIWRS